MKLALGILTIAMMMACGEVVDPPNPDPCASGNCECTAATEATDCGARQYCNETEAGRTCECVAGYTDGVNGCVWTGTIEDPGFAMTSVWQPANGALLNPTAVGGVDPGEASFLPSALCSLGHVLQTVDMPAFEKAEPLVLELSYKNPIVFQQGSDRVPMGVRFGDRWSQFPFFNDSNFHSLRICLPEGAYAPRGTPGKGAPVTFAFGPYDQPTGCPSSMITNFAVDHAAIVAANAGECSDRFGQDVNFDAEGTGGWTFNTSGTSSAGFVNGVGANGSRGARIVLGQRCDSASLETRFNVPDVANPAFEMFVSAGPNANPTISFGTLFSFSLFPSSSPLARSRTLHLCMPPAMRGQTMSVSMSVSGGSGSCADVLNLSAVADNVRVVDDPACAGTETFTNAGFEQGDVPWGAFGLTSAATGAAALIRNAPGQARSGTRYLALESYGGCSSSGYTMLPTVPAPDGAAGPALKFFALAGVNPDASTTVSVRGTPSQPITEGGGYRQYTVCLPPLYVGRPLPVTLRHYGGGSVCSSANYVQQNTFIDDVEVTTEPTCPAQ